MPLKISCDNLQGMAKELLRKGYDTDRIFIKVGGNNDDINESFLGPIAERNGSAFLTECGIGGIVTFTYREGLDPGELRLLAKLHDIAPGNVVAPIAEIYVSDPRMEGHLRRIAHVTELRDGLSLAHFLSTGKCSNGKEKRDTFIWAGREAISVLKALHESRAAHGDAHIGNILVSSGTIALIDPQRKRSLESAIRSDLRHMTWIGEQIAEFERREV